MNNKRIFIGLLVFGAGVGSGYFLGFKRAKAQFKEDVSDIQDFYSNKLIEMGVMDKDFIPADMIDSIIEEDEVDYDAAKEYFDKVTAYAPDNSNIVEIRGKGRPIINYNKPPLIVEHYGDLEGDEESDEDDDVSDEEYEAALEARAEEFAKRRHQNQTKGLPYTINFDEYQDENMGYEHQVLYYYSGDRVLCEDDDSVVEDEEELVGLDYEDVLEMQTTAWVRNDKVLNIYEIHRIDEKYSESVANAVETPRERDFRITGRRKQGLDN